MNRQQLTDAFNRLQQEREKARHVERSGNLPTASAEQPSTRRERTPTGNSLDNAPDVGRAFDAASHGIRPQDTGQGRESSQVKGECHRHDMRPPPEIAQQADREKHQAEKAADARDAQAEHYRALADSLEQRKGQSGPERGPGMGL